MAYSIIKEHVDPRNLSVNVTSSSGRVFRWGHDESAPENIPSGIAIATRIPGGFATLDCQLARKPDVDYYDLDRFAPITCYGGNGSLVAFDGYLSSRPMNRGTSYTFSPEAIGWSGTMKDDPSFTMVYIDRELSKWTSPTTARQLQNLVNGNQTSVWSASGAADTNGEPALIVSGTGAWLANSLGEFWYDAGPKNVIEEIAATYVNLAGASAGFGAGDTNAIVRLFTSNGTDGPFTVTSGTALHPSATAQSLFVANSAANMRYGILQAIYAVAAGTSGNTYGWILENLQVHGNHGLSGRFGPSGDGVGGRDNGYYGGDLIADIVSRVCPLLTVNRGSSGVVNDTFVVPQAAFNQPVDADTAVQQINAYYLYDYGVYENREFFWRPAATGTEWHVRVGDGAQVSDQGPQIETAFNGVIIQYTDPAGNSRVVGPPPFTWDRDPITGAANSTLLEDTSSSNIVNQYGRTRRSLVQMGTTTWQGAVTVGKIFLETTSSRPSSGTATITGFAVDSNGREAPAWMMRAGDTVVFDDTSDTTPRYILETSYNHDSLQNTLTLDAPPNKLDWILQRLGLVIAPLG